MFRGTELSSCFHSSWLLCVIDQSNIPRGGNFLGAAVKTTTGGFSTVLTWPLPCPYLALSLIPFLKKVKCNNFILLKTF